MNTKKTLLGSALVLYFVIAFEVLIMISPFAGFFYSIFNPVLLKLAGHPSTRWLSAFYLPHMVLPQDWCGLKPVFPVSSGGLHPGLVPDVMRLLGKDIEIQMGGGIWGHPCGGRAGATALRQSIDAVLKGIPLEKYAETKTELKRALETWGHTLTR